MYHINPLTQYTFKYSKLLNNNHACYIDINAVNLVNIQTYKTHTNNTDITNFTLALEKVTKKGVHSQIENLLLLSFPGNNLNPLDLKSMAFFTI